MDENTILEFRDVCLEASRQGSALRDMTFDLAGGDAVFVRTGGSDEATRLCDAAEGLMPLRSGEIRFLGRTWDAGTPFGISSLRSRIGRVFSGTAWISNLDVYDNIVLRARHHGAVSEAALRAEVLQLARACGIADIPAGRHNVTPGDVLRRLQWVRAFLTHPSLVVLEDPVDGLASDDVGRLADLVTGARGEGTAVLWVSSLLPACDILSFTDRYVLRNGKLALMERGSG